MKTRAIGVGLVAALLGVLVTAVTGTSSSAAVTKNLTGQCSGADAATNGYLAALGGSSLAVPFSINADVPASLTPQQTGVNVAFTWTVSVDTALVNKATSVGLNKMTVKNAKLDIGITGPTTTQEIQGRPASQVLNLVPNTPASITVGPFGGPLEGIGDSGIVKYATKEISFTMGVSLAGKNIDLNIKCNAGATVATSPIKVPGSPEVTQPISLNAAAGENVNVDVLGQYVRNGVTPGGVEKPVVPDTLKVVDGPGSVSGGQVAITAGGPGSTTSVTFEVCAAPEEIAPATEGVDLVQTLQLDPAWENTKRVVGFTLKVGDQETAPIWAANINILGALAGLTLPGAKIGNWQDAANSYLLGTEFAPPSAGAVQNAIAALPGVGTGNVVVTKTGALSYDIQFTGALGKKDIVGVTLGTVHGIWPFEVLDQLLGLASSLGGGGGSGPPIPGGLTPEQYLAQLQAEAEAALASLNIPLWFEKVQLILPLTFSQALANIDTDAVVAGLTGIFPKRPDITVTVAGEDPQPAQVQEYCSQGVIDVVVAPDVAAETTIAGGGVPTDVAGETATRGGSSLAFTG